MKSILLVEGDAGARETLSAILARSGYKTISLSTPSKALALLRTYKPDIVISGNKFHDDMEGIELGDGIRNLKIPFVLLSGIPSVIREARRKGIVAVSKPYLIKDLLWAINHAMGAA